MQVNVYRVLIGLGMLLGYLHVPAQNLWENLGPDNLGNITRALAFDNDGNLLAGSQGGGLWRSTNQGDSWQPVSSYGSNGENPNITSIAVSGNTIYVATGATAFDPSYFVTDLSFTGVYDFRDEATGFKGYLTGLPGGGVYVSGDNGSTWSRASYFESNSEIDQFKGPFVSIQKIHLYERSGGTRIFVASLEGLYYSDDNLATLVPCEGSPVFESAVAFDVEVASADGQDVIFAGVSATQAGARDSLYRSLDGGTTFDAVRAAPLYRDLRGNPSIFSFQRTEIAVAPSDPSIVYVGTTNAVGEVKNVFRGDNGGINDNVETWRTYAPSGSGTFTPLGRDGQDAFVLKVFPDNPDELILAGNNWYTFTRARGWVQTASHFSPLASAYIPRLMYDVLFDPNDAETLYVGTSKQIARSQDRGETFVLRSKGYEGFVSYSVASAKVQVEGEEPLNYDFVFSGTPFDGTIYNGVYSRDIPSRQGFSSFTVSENDPRPTVNYSEVGASVLNPGSLLIEGNDGGSEDGLLRSLNFGQAFTEFYGVPISPQVADLNTATDTIIDRENSNSEGGNLFNDGTVAQTPWVLDEVVPDSLVERLDLTDEEIQALAPSYVYFCSRNYVWVVTDPFGDALQVKWNRLTNSLVDGVNEYFTTITVSGDDDHTLYVGSSRGSVWRIDRPHDLENFSAVDNVTKLSDLTESNLFFMEDRWVTDITVDPKDPERVAISFGGYGGDQLGFFSNIWFSTAAKTNPVFKALQDPAGFTHLRPAYTAEFIVDPGPDRSFLWLGNEDGLYVLDNLRDLVGNPFLGAADFKLELGPQIGSVPVYDISVRDYSVRVIEGALERIEVRKIVTPDTTIFDTVEVRRDNLFLMDDNTVFIATHGRGIWSTASLNGQREGRPVDPVALSDITLRPNPVVEGGKVQVHFGAEAEGTVAIEAFSLDGRQMLRQGHGFAPGEQQVAIPVTGWAAGIYLIKVVVQEEGEARARTFKLLLTHE